jgi:tetraacyldisaccharide 4'-kinase
MILPPLGVLYGATMRARASLYRRGLLKVAKLNASVISVGNITTGGTGKTPLVEFIARKLAAEGLKVCVLTRGYGRQNPKSRVVVSDGQTILASAEEAGDEPRLLAENLSSIAAVISDANRRAAGEWAMQALGSNVFILDDGFQHLQLARDLNIVSIDATNPWGGGLLPYGRMREPREALARADCFVITRADQSSGVDQLKGELEKLSQASRVFTSRMTVRGLRQLEDQSSYETDRRIPSIEQPVGCFCAVGNPGSFISQLKAGAYDPAIVAVFPDHFKYRQADVDTLVKAAREAGVRSLTTTAKDAVKLRDLRFDLPCYVLDIEISVENEFEFLKLVHAATASRIS